MSITTPAWWTSAVVYQIYPRSFADSNGDGIGDLGGIRGKLDYLQQLGVDVVWLSPIYRSPQADNGYDISDDRDIDPLFGSLREFDLLLAEAHARGIKIVMDLVVNHTSDEHAWFAKSRSSLTNPKRDWYVWRDGLDGREPNLWRSMFGGSAWQLDAVTGQHYLHLFAVKQPDLNWENPEVRGAVYSMMNWWLDRGVDGFRMDVINLIAKVQSDLVGDSPGFVMGDQVHDYLREMNREVFAGRESDLITVGETPGATVDDAIRFTSSDRLELDMVFQFEHVGLDHGPRCKFDNVPLQLVDLKSSLGRWQNGLATSGWNSLYFGNHDQPRSVSRFGDDGQFRYESATLLAAILHLHRGTPYIYQGDEIGMTNAGFMTIDQYQDIESLNYYDEEVAAGASPAALLESLAFRSRDNARTPVPWDATPGAGFTTGTLWLAITPNHATINMATDRASGSRSIFEFYRRLIALRHGSSVVSLGDFVMLEPEHPTLYAFTRSLGGETLVVVGNFSSEPLELPPAVAGDLVIGNLVIGDLVIGNYGEVPDVAGALRPWEVRVVRRGEIHGRASFAAGMGCGVSTSGSRRRGVADGILLCRFHHMLVHNNGWQILRDGAEYWLKPPVSEDPLQILQPMPSKSPALAELLSNRLVV